MISNIASFIFGSSEPVSTSTEFSCSLHTTPIDDEWVLVDTSHFTEPTEDSLPYISTEEMEPAIASSDSNPNSPIKHNNTPPSSTNKSTLTRAESNWSLDSSWQITHPCFDVGSKAPAEVSPVENLLIEHASMSVYGSLPASYSRQSDVGDLFSSSDNEVEVAAARPLARVCASSRSEHYNLRKSTVKQARQVKKMRTKRAFQRQNQTTHLQQRSRRSSPLVVFQPRK